jgi:hypothetical protein
VKAETSDAFDSAVAYLEWLVHEQEVTEERVHTKLADNYIKTVGRLKASGSGRD